MPVPSKRHIVHNQIEDSTSIHLGYLGVSICGVCERCWLGGVPKGVLNGLFESDRSLDESVSLTAELVLWVERGETVTVKGGASDSERGGSLAAFFSV